MTGRAGDHTACGRDGEGSGERRRSCTEQSGVGHGRAEQTSFVCGDCLTGVHRARKASALPARVDQEHALRREEAADGHRAVVLGSVICA
eukprot:3581667-Pleurochrysis_carterae.AAC.1